MEIILDQPASSFDLDHTLRSGQVFRWTEIDGWWYGVVRERVVKIRQTDDKLEFEIFPDDSGIDFIRDYFRLNDDLPLILSKIARDQHIQNAIRYSYGLRITRQEPWECLISYICATYKNIPAIKKMIGNLAKEYGETIRFEHRDFYTFPKPNRLAKATLDQLKKCRLGYRAKYILETSRRINYREYDLGVLGGENYERAKNELPRLPGVGQKAADCVLLFSLDKLEAFPVDVWIKRVITKFYANHFEESFIRRISDKSSVSSGEYEALGSFGRNYFGEYAGYAQEYLFYCYRFGAIHS